jgi:hypothetical protein
MGCFDGDTILLQDRARRNGMSRIKEYFIHFAPKSQRFAIAVGSLMLLY